MIQKRLGKVVGGAAGNGYCGPEVGPRCISQPVAKGAPPSTYPRLADLKFT